MHKTGTGKDKIDQIIEKYNCEPGSLIQVLLDIQQELNWLPGDALERISKRLNVPLQKVRHAATFYKVFSIMPRGRHKVHVCMGTACHVRGSSRILDSVEQATGIKPGETDPDLRFSLETVNCLGCCALGPVAEIDGMVHGKMTPGKTVEILKDYE
jgi:NADH-quinone oxidoreductase subunit E